MSLYIGNQKVAPAISTIIGAKYGATASTFLGNVDANGVLQKPTEETNLVFTDVEDIGSAVLVYFAYRNYSGQSYSFNNIKTVSFPDLTTLSGNYALNYAFNSCTGLTSVDLSSLTTVSGRSAMQYAFSGCTGLTSVDLSSLTTVSGSSAMASAFSGYAGLTSVDLSSLTTVSGSSALGSAFYNCAGLTSVDLSSLATVSGSSAMSSAFSNTKLTTLSFPSLNSNSFGSYTDQFNNMLKSVTGCTVHFPSNLQSVIGSWTSVTGGFGGTNTTVLFDLPATT